MIAARRGRTFPGSHLEPAEDRQWPTATFVHFEIPANDPPALVKFCSDLFRWKADVDPQGNICGLWEMAQG